MTTLQRSPSKSGPLPCPSGRRFPSREAVEAAKPGAVARECGCGSWHGTRPLRAGKHARDGRGPLRPVSAKRSAENRQRRKMATATFGEHPPCSRPGCGRMADDLHEPLTRARGGSVSDPANARPLCRACHDEVTFAPESELGWAYECGLLVHSWDGAS